MSSFIMNTYNRYPVSFVNGKGSWLKSENGDDYLDFAAGIAVNILGHNHPKLNKAMIENVDKIWHLSNLYKIPEQEKLAEKLCSLSFAEKVFFCNSGAEAVEGAIKVARKYFYSKGETLRNEIITFSGSFHGRTLATLAAAGNPNYSEGFGPMPEGFISVPFADHDAFKRAINKNTAAVLLETIQGEGGIRVLPDNCLKEIRKICTNNGILLIIDEVQSGMYRTGSLFAYDWASIEPDIVTIAKAIGGGFPLGAILTNEKASQGMVNGTHGSTVGGNPLACTLGKKVLDTIEDEDIVSNVKIISQIIFEGLEVLLKKHVKKISGVRGKGLMIGIECLEKNSVITEEAFKQGLLLVNAGDNVIRMLPPLNISQQDAEAGIQKLDQALSNIKI